MNHKKQHSSWLFFLVTCCLISLLTACGSQSAPGTGNSGATPGASSTQSIASNPTPGSQGSPQTMPMPVTTTACPAANDGRAAVTRPLVLGQSQNLVYAYKDAASTWHLRRYNVATGQKIDIYTTGAGAIEQAQVSADGAWVLFLLDFYPAMRTDARAKIEMVRMDGQGAQTLYCFPTNEQFTPGPGSGAGAPPVTVQWSPNQKALLFSADTAGNTSTIYNLDMTSGNVRAVYKDAGNTLYATSIVTWLDNANAYIITQGRSAPQPPATIHLLNIPGSSLGHPTKTPIFQGGGRMNELSIDSSFDGSKLYIDDCLLAGAPFKTTVSVEPAHGGARQSIYQPPAALCVDEIRVISSTTMLMLVSNYNTSTSLIQHQVWTMHTDGTGQHTLNTLPVNDSRYLLNPNTQDVWSNISRDGSTYALEQYTNQGVENLLIGSLNGGTPTTFASSQYDTLVLAGWTTM